MPRKDRELYDGAVYHVINRGHNKQILFRCDEDYRELRGIIKRYKRKYGFKVLNYCFIINHFHMIIQINKGETLPWIMQSIAQAYAKYHKKQYRNVGYLFQGRYKSHIIENDAYLLECARYVERNPLAAELISDLNEYEWSSYNYYSLGKKDEIIDGNILYEQFGVNETERRAYYAHYVLQPRPEELMSGKKK